MSDINLSLNKEVVQPIIEAKIRAAIIEVMSKDSTTIVEKMVEEALTTKVDRDGKRNRDSYCNKYLFIEWLCEDTIHKAAIEAMGEYLKENHQLIKDAFIKKLSQRGHAGKLAEGLIDSIVDGIKNTFNWNMKISFAPKTEN